VTFEREVGESRWFAAGGDCIDVVHRGCFNGGQCVAPDTCLCPPGWEGHDCSLPVCSQSASEITVSTTTSTRWGGDQFLPPTLVRINDTNTGADDGTSPPPALPGDKFVQFRQCPNGGNCTHPDTCTCEKGWAGSDCSIPICAQECFNGGFCSAPDTCTCVTRAGAFEDNRGQPYFRKSDGNPQETGWTGFDCSVPICTQAERFVLNDDEGTVRLAAGVVNDGRNFQGGCSPATEYTPLNRTRSSESLCGREIWYQGSYDESWANDEDASFRSDGRFRRVNHPNFVQIDAQTWVDGPKFDGEGIYSCFNDGACTAPETCNCTDGWEGYDCNSPVCRYTDFYGNIRGCQNSGICAGPNDCQCIQHESLLPRAHPEVRPATTGWTGQDCSIAICAQGYYDPECTDVPPGPGGVSSGGQGCYRCSNGGNCTAPDVCTCPPDWTGFDCRTPVCT